MALRRVTCPRGSWPLVPVGSPPGNKPEAVAGCGPGGVASTWRFTLQHTPVVFVSSRKFLDSRKFPPPLFFSGSRDWSIHSWNTKKITKIYTFSPSCGSRRGKRSLHYCIRKHGVQLQTTQLDLQLYIHCLHSKDANLQVVYKKDCPGHLCISRSADACNYTHIKGICIFLAHPSSENKINFRELAPTWVLSPRHSPWLQLVSFEILQLILMLISVGALLAGLVEILCSLALLHQSCNSTSKEKKDHFNPDQDAKPAYSVAPQTTLPAQQRGSMGALRSAEEWVLRKW